MACKRNKGQKSSMPRRTTTYSSIFSKSSLLFWVSCISIQKYQPEHRPLKLRKNYLQFFSALYALSFLAYQWFTWICLPETPQKGKTYSPKDPKRKAQGFKHHQKFTKSGFSIPLLWAVDFLSKSKGPWAGES